MEILMELPGLVFRSTCVWHNIY